MNSNRRRFSRAEERKVCETPAEIGSDRVCETGSIGEGKRLPAR
jgi:hypothetical protein